MYFYAQEVDQYKYYEIVTSSAEKASPGCPNAVRRSLALMMTLPMEDIIDALNICPTLPAYINNRSILVEEINMVVMYSFANLNMANYPPPHTSLQAACDSIQATHDPLEALKDFLHTYGQSSSTSHSCFNMYKQLPSGQHATISSGDWSGVGVGRDGEMWDYETCTFLVETIGTNNVTDMFLPREWTSSWLQHHCKERFNVNPQPTALVNDWGFNRLNSVGASYILFTNGLNDGWSAGGVVKDQSDTILTVNIPNGAHHSDLSPNKSSYPDPPEILEARDQIAMVLHKWLNEIQSEGVMNKM